MYEIPKTFMDQFIVKICDACGLEHAPIRTCEDAKVFHAFNQENNQ